MSFSLKYAFAASEVKAASMDAGFPPICWKTLSKAVQMVLQSLFFLGTTATILLKVSTARSPFSYSHVSSRIL